MKVVDGTVISIRYVLKNAKGEILEDRMEGKPVTYFHGIGQIMPELENNLTGSRAGDRKSFNFSQGFGNPYACEVIIDAIRSATAEELKKGQIFQEYEEGCGEDCNC